jgi:hypothetical protein
MIDRIEHHTQHVPARDTFLGASTVKATNEQARGDRHNIDDRYNFHDASFRRHYQLNYHDTGRDYEAFYAPAYRFGYELALENAGTNWEMVKREAQRHWQTRHPSAWEDVADAIHYGWEEQRDPEALRVHHEGPE